MTDKRKIRYSKSIQESVVHAIVNGELLIEEAMDKYHIHTKRSIVRWLKRYNGRDAAATKNNVAPRSYKLEEATEYGIKLGTGISMEDLLRLLGTTTEITVTMQGKTIEIRRKKSL